MTSSSMISESLVSPARLYRSATRPYAASPPFTTVVTSPFMTGSISIRFGFPDTPAATPNDSVTSANITDVNQTHSFN